MPSGANPAKSVDDGEIARFAALADEWWCGDGELRMLHQLNPVRSAYIRDHASAHFGLDASGAQPLKGLRIIDIGCGGGILAEPLARMGAGLVGLDADENAIEAAKLHAGQEELEIDYRCASAEELAASGETFDIVLGMEVIEHVADIDSFLTACGALVADGGLFFGATINRTMKSFALAIVGAEVILRWVPRGTHQWDKFVRPSELARGLKAVGLSANDVTGVIYDPLRATWKTGSDTAVNYMIAATKV